MNDKIEDVIVSVNSMVKDGKPAQIPQTLKKNRLFVFGCSFTMYAWPTYADFLGYEFDLL